MHRAIAYKLETTGNRGGNMKIYVVGSSRNRFFQLDGIRKKFLIDSPHPGDNIDQLNRWLCEMTGLYYMWKNEPEDILGLEHYRRHFADPSGGLLSKGDIHSILTDYDIIVPRANYSRSSPPKTWLIRNGKYLDMIRFLAWIHATCGDRFYQKCIDHLDGDYHCLGNMFIARKNLVDAYCSYIFPAVLTFMDCESRHGRVVPDRACGYFTEFLFGAWLEYTGRKMFFSNWELIR